MRSDNMPRPFAPEHGEEAESQLQRDIAEVDFLVAEFAGTEITAAWQRIRARIAELEAEVHAHTEAVKVFEAANAELQADAERMNYIERTFAGCTTQDRYLPIRMIWGKGCNGRTLREACDKYMKRDAAIDAARGAK